MFRLTGIKNSVYARIPGALFLLLCALPFTLKAQPELDNRNLVINSSFEDPNVCEHGITCAPIGWYSTQNGQVTYYVPTSKAHSGRYLLGVILLIEGTDKRTYVQTPLRCDLEAGVTYEFEMYIKPKNYASNAIGVFFSNSVIDSVSNFRVNVTPHLLFYASEPFLRKDNKWIRMHGTYTAKGGERYLVLGNFLESGECSMKRIGKAMKRPKSVYYIDDISLKPMNNRQLCSYEEFEAYVYEDWNRHPYSPFLFNKKNIKGLNREPLPLLNADTSLNIGSTVILNNILFETAKSTLLSASYRELNELAKLLGKHPSMEIEISGHTDNTGSVKLNDKLSKDRATSVVNYLLSTGINNTRLTGKGYGSDAPIAPNNTVDGRRKNRRVEFKVLKL